MKRPKIIATPLGPKSKRFIERDHAVTSYLRLAPSFVLMRGQAHVGIEIFEETLAKVEKDR